MVAFFFYYPWNVDGYNYLFQTSEVGKESYAISIENQLAKAKIFDCDVTE